MSVYVYLDLGSQDTLYLYMHIESRQGKKVSGSPPIHQYTKRFN